MAATLGSELICSLSLAPNLKTQWDEGDDHKKELHPYVCEDMPEYNAIQNRVSFRPWAPALYFGP